MQMTVHDMIGQVSGSRIQVRTKGIDDLLSKIQRKHGKKRPPVMNLPNLQRGCFEGILLYEPLTPRHVWLHTDDGHRLAIPVNRITGVKRVPDGVG